jgi:type I restriction enzyme S subunit
MFGDPLSNQKGWPMSNFGTEMKLVQYGPRFYNQPYTPTGVHVIRITDLDVFGNLAYDQMPRFDAPRDAIRTFGLQTGDLVFARSGATVGKTAVIGSDAPPCIAGAYFMRIQFHARITPIYARMVLASNSVQNIITRQSRQSAQQNFSGPSLRRLPLPVPPMDIQQRFCGVERAIRAHAVLLSSHLLDADHLFNALVQQAFSGDLLTDRTKAAHPSL